VGRGIVAIALTGLFVFVLACTDKPDNSSGCRDTSTREELKEVRDANGVLLPVRKVISEIGSLSIDDCGVSVAAQLGSDESGFADVAGVVYHPLTGEEIRVSEARRGIYKFRWPSGYEWS